MYFGNTIWNRLAKPSWSGRHMGLLSQDQNSDLWRPNIKSKVCTVFVAGIFRKIIKKRPYISLNGWEFYSKLFWLFLKFIQVKHAKNLYLKTFSFHGNNRFSIDSVRVTEFENFILHYLIQMIWRFNNKFCCLAIFDKALATFAQIAKKRFDIFKYQRNFGSKHFAKSFFKISWSHNIQVSADVSIFKCNLKKHTISTKDYNTYK